MLDKVKTVSLLKRIHDDVKRAIWDSSDDLQPYDDGFNNGKLRILKIVLSEIEKGKFDMKDTKDD